MHTCITQRGGGERGDKATCRFSPFSHESIDVIRVQLGCLGDPWVAHNVLHSDPHRRLQQENPVKQVTQARGQALAEFGPLPPEQLIRQGHPQYAEVGSCPHVGIQFGTMNREWE